MARLTINTGTTLWPAQSSCAHQCNSLVPDTPTTCAAAAEGGAAVEGLEGGDNDEDHEEDEASDWDESDDWSDEEDLAAFELQVASFLAAVEDQSRSQPRAKRVSPIRELLLKLHPAHALQRRPRSGKHSPHTRLPHWKKL